MNKKHSSKASKIKNISGDATVAIDNFFKQENKDD